MGVYHSFLARKVMKNKLRSYWKNLNQDDKILLLLLPFPVIITVLTFGICICLNKAGDCNIADVFYWPVDFLHTSNQLICDGLHRILLLLSAATQWATSLTDENGKIVLKVVQESSIWQVFLFSLNFGLVGYMIYLIGKKIKRTIPATETHWALHHFKVKVQDPYKNDYYGLSMLLPLVIAVGSYTLCICIQSDHCHLLTPVAFFMSLARCSVSGILQMTKKTLQGLMWILRCNQKYVVPVPQKLVMPTMPTLDEDWWKVPLVVVSVILAAVLLFFLITWLVRLFKRMRLDNTILLINNDGKWEYAPSEKRLQIEAT